MDQYQKNINSAEHRINHVNDKCNKLEEVVRDLQRVYKEKLSVVETMLKESASRCVIFVAGVFCLLVLFTNFSCLELY